MPGDLPKQQRRHSGQARELFENCIGQHAESIYRVAFRMTGNRDMAEELIQETYLNAWKNIDSLNDRSKIRGWLFAILRNQFSKQLRKKPKTSQLKPETLDTLALERSPENETEQLVQAGIEKLADEQKLPLLLVSMEGMTVDAAAEVLGIPRGTVLSRLHRGRQKLKQTLLQQGVISSE